MNCAIKKDGLEDLLSQALNPADIERGLAADQPGFFVEKCKDCRGRGRFISYAGRDCGPCFKCDGKGERLFKTSSAQRLQARQKAAEKKKRTSDEAFAWYTEHKPELMAWITAKQSGFAFAGSLMDAIRKYGELSEKQEAAAMRCMERDRVRDAERKAAQVARLEAAPAVEMAKIEEAFVNSAGMFKPRLKVAGFTIKPAPATGSNAGALYVTRGQTYVGKIAGGKFLASRDCSDEEAKRLVAVCAGPEAAAAHGKETGICAVCGAFLENPESVARGIGPICFAKYGRGTMFVCKEVKAVRS